MNSSKSIICLVLILFLSSCANNKVIKSSKQVKNKYYSSGGFAFVYEESYFKERVISKKLNTNEISTIHSILPKNTPIKIINPKNSKVIETKITKMAKYPMIFNIVISNKIAEILELDLENPYVEIIEVKRNKTFIAKESNTFEEEKRVAETAPVDDVEMQDLTSSKTLKIKKESKKNTYLLVVSDFYYYDSANNLKKKLIKQTQINNFSIKKLSNNKYRLSVGPFKNFNTLKFTYISLNNLGFDEMNVYIE